MSDRPKLPQISEDTTDEDTGQTRATSPATRGMPPQQSRTPPPPQPPRRRPPPPPRKVRSRGDSGLYFPWWSILLTLGIVFAIAGGIVLLVYTLGGRTVPESQPVVIVSSPVPTERPASFPVSPVTPTLPPEIDPAGASGGAREGGFTLAGPTLVPVEMSPTPRSLALGERVRVVDVGVQQLNVRNRAGVLDTSIVFRAEEGSIFVLADGPQQSDGLTWWRIEDPNNPSRTGWAASNYLQMLPEDEQE